MAPCGSNVYTWRQQYLHTVTATSHIAIATLKADISSLATNIGTNIYKQWQHLQTVTATITNKVSTYAHCSSNIYTQQQQHLHREAATFTRNIIYNNAYT